MKNTILLILSFLHLSISAQIDFGKLSPTPEMIMQVKQFDEFIDRFNYKKTPANQPIDTSFSNHISRSIYISYLFNLEDKRIIEKDNDYLNRIEIFLADITNTKNPLYIHRFSENISIEAKGIVRHQRKEKEITILFQNKHIGSNALKWEISGIDGKAWKQFYDSSFQFITPETNISIYPNAAETNFIMLKQLFDNKKNIKAAFAPYALTNTNTAGFAQMIYNGDVEFLYIRTFKYIILLGDWQIELKNFIRKTRNSGWLISNITHKL